MFGDNNNAAKTLQHFKIVIHANSLTPQNRRDLNDEADRTITFPELPSSVTVSKDANYSDERIPGRSEPYKIYSESGATMIDFGIQLVATGTSAPRRGGAAAAAVGGAVSVGGQIANRFGADGILARAITIGGLLKDTVAPDFLASG